MNEMVNFSKMKKLSKQQKAILEYLVKQWNGFCTVKKLSWYIAEKFNEDDTWLGKKNRFYEYNVERHRKYLQKRYEEAKEKEDTNMIEALYWESVIFKANLYMYDENYGGKKPPKRLTNLHKASFYRSVRRLKERSLIILFDNKHIDEEYLKENKKIRYKYTIKKKNYHKYIGLSIEFYQKYKG